MSLDDGESKIGSGMDWIFALAERRDVLQLA